MRTSLVAVGLAVLLVVMAVGWVEEGEVATLVTTDAEDRVHETKLWIVDLDGALYVRAGGAGDRWLERLRRRPEAQLWRNGVSAVVRATPVRDPRVRDAVNRAMSRKYGGVDRASGWLHGPARAVPVRLDPVTATH